MRYRPPASFVRAFLVNSWNKYLINSGLMYCLHYIVHAYYWIANEFFIIDSDIIFSFVEEILYLRALFDEGVGMDTVHIMSFLGIKQISFVEGQKNMFRASWSFRMHKIYITFFIANLFNRTYIPVFVIHTGYIMAYTQARKFESL